MTTTSMETRDLATGQVGSDATPRQIDQCLSEWRKYNEQGLKVFPLVRGAKHPGNFGIKWGEDWIKKDRNPIELLDIYETGTYGLWLATGQCSKRVVLDIDSIEAETHWRPIIGEAIYDVTLRATSGRVKNDFAGYHLHFRIREDDHREWKGHSGEDGSATGAYDFRGDGGGVVLPPSIHETGRQYAWVEGTRLMDAPDVLRKEVVEGAAKRGRIKQPQFAAKNMKWWERAMLPSDDPGRGNNNLMSVIGGIAKTFVEKGLSYEVALAVASSYEGASDDPQSWDLVQARLTHYWEVEEQKQKAHRSQFDPETGYLTPSKEGVGYVTLANNMKGGEEEVQFGNFWIQATSVHSVDGRTTWVVDLTHKDGTVYRDVELDHETLSSTQALRRWLAGYRCSLFFTNDRDQRGPAGIRLQNLLLSQNPVNCRIVDRLGWDDQARAFITYEGAIMGDLINPGAGVRPNRNLEKDGQVHHFYGFRPEEETREVLREVLTFQEPTYASVFAAWYVAGIVKGLLMPVTSMFPILMTEAPAESGKTKGFPSLMYQLSGSRERESGTKSAPAFRDSMAAHRGAPVWVDDSETVEALKENLRQVPVEGYAVKMGENRTTQVKRKLTAPVLISAEGIAMVHQEKAIKDRSVLLNTPDARGRMSLKDPTRPQWDDILDLQAKYPDGLSVMAGRLVQMALRHAPGHIAEFKDLRGGSGRHADKMAILRVGARILADITQDPSHIGRVDAWAGEQVDTGAENALTFKVIPAALKLIGLKDKPVRIDRAPHHGVPTPVLHRPGTEEATPALWVHFGFLAQWWEKNTFGRVAERTETESALRMQGQVLGMKGKKAGKQGDDWMQVRVQGDSSRSLYQRLPDEVTERVIALLETEYAEEEPGDGKTRLTPSQVEAIGRM
ncbi:bifunctional DNA primase/polymerase [Streptomyces sp. bgisy153]|uniref:bifunctional DNA primase/polymerase n=1 Tax=Streptomyces sp. bgisy153 TaxID=3413793 RepID=UPI003D757B67